VFHISLQRCKLFGSPDTVKINFSKFFCLLTDPDPGGSKGSGTLLLSYKLSTFTHLCIYVTFEKLSVREKLSVPPPHIVAPMMAGELTVLLLD
jgi:hypothetical protein